MISLDYAVFIQYGWISPGILIYTFSDALRLDGGIPKKGDRYPCTTGIGEQKETPEDRYKRSAGLWKDRIQQHLPPLCSCQNVDNKTVRWTTARKIREKGISSGGF